MLQEHYLDLVRRVDALVAALVEHPDEQVREQALELLQLIDLMHREALLRLTDALRAAGAGGTLDRVAEEDAVVRLLLGMYDLAELGLPEESAGHAAGEGFFPMEQLAVRRRSAGNP